MWEGGPVLKLGFLIVLTNLSSGVYGGRIDSGEEA